MRALTDLNLRRAALIAAVLAAVPSSAIAAPGAQPPAPEFYAESLENRLFAEGRGFDQVTNPEYIERSSGDVAKFIAGSDTQSIFSDPFRKDWGTTRGRALPVSYRNRYGARIAGQLFGPRLPYSDPVTGRPAGRRLPAIVMVNGLGAPQETYFGIVQSLAESGYVVMSFDPQGQGGSEDDPRPSKKFCKPGGTWTKPQEAGIRETGECAGVYEFPESAASPLEPLAAPFFASPAPGIGFAIEGLPFVIEEHSEPSDIQPLYDAAGPNFVFGALDALAWMRSKANPWHDRIDFRRVGVMGHSLGAYGALVSANGDPDQGFSAAVTFDGFGLPPKGARPHVPTMLQLAEGENYAGPRLERGSPDRHPSAQVGKQFRRAGVETMQVALRGSTHQEWSFTPYQLPNPVQGPFVNASSEGERVAVFYALAWFDRYLKGIAFRGPPNNRELAQRRSAVGRLLGRTFDDSADRSAIGVGRADSRGRNVPYPLAGEAIVDHLSRFLRSAYAFESHECKDVLRSRC